MRLIATIGDCNGIGIEILLKALRNLLPSCKEFFSIIISGNIGTIAEYAEKIQFPIKSEGNNIIIDSNNVEILHCSAYSNVNFGKVSEEAGKLAIESIENAVEFIQNSNADGLITMPINKGTVYLAGWKYLGHTEFLAHKSNVDNPLMILFNNEIRVALVTIHIPLKLVTNEINIVQIVDKLSVFNSSLKQDYCINAPRIAVLGVNPHSGENGNIGDEEIKIITPAISQARADGINAYGPFPADGFFAHQLWKQFDGILAMYHDQGLIPIKMLSKGEGVNFTAGLPFVRTSVDHGTAFEIAGKGIANEISAINAILNCYKILVNRQNNTK